MLGRSRERGEGKGGCIVSLIIFLAAIFVAYKMIPVKVKAAEMRQTIVDEAKSAGSRNDARIRKAIMAKASELDLPLNDKDLRISRGHNRIKIEANYVVPVTFPGYTYQWKFHHSYENPIF